MAKMLENKEDKESVANVIAKVLLVVLNAVVSTTHSVLYFGFIVLPLVHAIAVEPAPPILK